MTQTSSSSTIPGSITLNASGIHINSTITTNAITTNAISAHSVGIRPIKEPTLPEITPGGLEALAERLDLMALEQDMPELLEISEALAKHFYTHERLSNQIDNLREELVQSRNRERYSEHNPRERDRMDAMFYQRYAAGVDPIMSNKPFKMSGV